MEVGMFILNAVSVLCILAEAWAALRIQRAYQEALKKEETWGMFGETIEPYLRTILIAAVCLCICTILRIIFR